MDAVSVPSSRTAKSSQKGPSAQDKRRAAALKRQKETRRGLLEQARELFVARGRNQNVGGDEDEYGGEQQQVPASFGNQKGARGESGKSSSESGGWKGNNRGNRVRERRRYWASQVTTPEWMVDVPAEGLNGQVNGGGSAVGEGWFVRARPEGKRCLVVAAGGATTSRQLDGQLMHKWNSALPLGSPQTNKGKGGGGVRGGDKEEQPFVLLDCVFDDATNTYWVLDGMAWKDVSLYDSTAEFRFYWLHSKLSECAVECGDAGLRLLPTLATPPPPPHPHSQAGNAGGFAAAPAPPPPASFSLPEPHSQYRVMMLPYYDCNPAGLEAAYAHTSLPFIRDGLLFYLKQGFYECGPSPLVLQWKDAHSSRYLVWGERQQAVLAVRDPLARAGGKQRSWVSQRDKKKKEEEEAKTIMTPVIQQNEQSCENTWSPEMGDDEGGGDSLGGNTGGDASTNGGGDCALFLVTLEGIVVGSMPRAFAASQRVHCGDLLKFTISGAFEELTVVPSEPLGGQPPDPEAAVPTPWGGSGVAAAATNPMTTATTATTTRHVLVEPLFEKRCSPSRALADSWSKLVFQSRARTTEQHAVQGEVVAHTPAAAAAVGGAEGGPGGVVVGGIQVGGESVTIHHLLAACQPSPHP